MKLQAGLLLCLLAAAVAAAGPEAKQQPADKQPLQEQGKASAPAPMQAGSMQERGMGRGGGGGGRGFGGGDRGFGGGHSHGSGFGGGGSHVGHNHGGNWNGGWGGRGGGRRFYNDAWSGPRYYAPAPVYYAPAPVYYPSAPAYDNSWTEVTYDNSCTCNEAHYSDCNSSPCNNLLSDSSTDYTTYETTTTEATTEYVETPADTNTWTISIGRKLRSEQAPRKLVAN